MESEVVVVPEAPKEATEDPKAQEQKAEPPISFSIRLKQGILTQLCSSGEEPESLTVVQDGIAVEGDCRFVYSPDGALLAVSKVNEVVVFRLHKLNVQGGVTALHFSQKSKYLVTWCRHDQEKQPKNLLVWDVATKEEDTVLCRPVNNEVQFHSALAEPQTVAARIRAEGMTKASIRGHMVATYAPEAKGAPARVQVYQYPDVQTVIATKSFFKSSDCKLMWNQTNTALLLWTTTDVDKSGKSYYGEASLYFINIKTKQTENVMLKQEGPVHDVAWSPSGAQFVVVYGYMPAQTTIFDAKGQPLADLGIQPRNTAKFSPDGKLLCVAGFGNLQGHIDIWDPRKLQKVGTAQAHSSAHYEWSPNSQFILTAVLTPRMTVDNGWKVFHYSGKEVASAKCDALWEVHWRPTFFRAFAPRDIPEKYYNQPAAAAPPKKAVYRPPGAGGREGIKIRQEGEGPRKYEPPPRQAAAPAARPAPKEPAMLVGDDQPVQKKKRGKAKGGAAGAAAAPVDTAEQNKARITKSLRSIEDLKARRENGGKLTPAQTKLIETEASLQQELAELSAPKSS